MRLLIFLGLLYLLYRVIRSLMASLAASGSAPHRQQTRAIDDVMVKDPFCEVYFPKKDAIRAIHKGQELYFCSTECRDKFLEAPAEKQKS